MTLYNMGSQFKRSMLEMQDIKNYLFSASANIVGIYKHSKEDDVREIIKNNPLFRVKAIGANNEVFIHERDDKFIHFRKHYNQELLIDEYEPEVIKLDYIGNNTFRLEVLTNEEYQQFVEVELSEEIKEIINTNADEKEALLQIIYCGIITGYDEIKSIDIKNSDTKFSCKMCTSEEVRNPKEWDEYAVDFKPNYEYELYRFLNDEFNYNRESYKVEIKL